MKMGNRNYIEIIKLCLRIYFLFHFSPTTGSLDLVEECTTTEDHHITRGYFTCCSVSNRGLPLLNSLDFDKGWAKCAVEPESSNEDPVISAWRVYRCIVFSGLLGKPLRPTTYANLVTEKYPALIRAKIMTKMSELEEEGAKFEVDVECLRRTPYPKVHLVRNLFYDAEKEICELDDSIKSNSYSKNKTSVSSVSHYRGNRRPSTSSRSSTDFASVLCQTCDRTLEMYHRNGDCCSNVPLPFPFLYLPFRYGNNDRVAQCTEDVVDDVGLPSDTTFAIHLKNLCYPSCEYYLSGVITEEDLWAGVEQIQSQSDLRSLILKMIPKYFAPKYKFELENFIMDNFKLAWTETPTFESKIKLSQRDVRNCDKGKLKNLLASCKAHRLIETTANLYLNRLCEDEYDVVDESNTSKDNGSYFPSYSSESDEAQEVTLDFNWKVLGGRTADEIIESRIRHFFSNNSAGPNQKRTSGSARPAKG